MIFSAIKRSVSFQGAASSVVGFKAPDDSGRCDPHAAVPYFYLDLLELCRGLGHGALAGF